MYMLKIRCQEKNCPYGKRNSRCCFGEIKVWEGMPQVIERHKCKRAHKGTLEYIFISIPPGCNEIE